MLARLAGDDGVALALVSGRAMHDLHALAEVPAGTFLIGSHGAERARVTTFGLDRDVVQLTDEQADRLASLGARGGADRPRPGRRLGGDQADRRRRAHPARARTTSPSRPSTRRSRSGSELGSGVLHGKDVVEISVLRASKGEALTALRDELGAPVRPVRGRRRHRRARVRGARATDDVTIKVGDGTTVARFRVDGPEELVAALGGARGRACRTLTRASCWSAVRTEA